MLVNKNIIVAVTGSIAAYKSPDLVRRLIEKGAKVKVILTNGGAKFITKLSLATVGATVYTDHNRAEMPHIILAKWADIIVVAPASANVIVKINNGSADDLLSLTILSAKAKKFIAPAMNKEMLANVTTQNNLTALKQKNITILPTAQGDQVCGDYGYGRMLEPQEIVACIINSYALHSLANKRVLITMGATIEKIDAVRYISNFSSGKMGLAIANECILRNLKTTIVYANIAVNLPKKSHNIEALSADNMYKEVMQHIDNNDIFIAVAAVGDYKAKNYNKHKIKKTNQSLQLDLIKNQDILEQITSLNSKIFCVGFCAETEDLTKHTKEKFINKKLDLIIANYIHDGFGTDNNKVLIMDSQKTLYIDNTKQYIATKILDIIEKSFIK